MTTVGAIIAAVVAAAAVLWGVLTKWRAGRALKAVTGEVVAASKAEVKAKAEATKVLDEAEAKSARLNKEAAEAIARPESASDWSTRMGARDK